MEMSEGEKLNGLGRIQAVCQAPIVKFWFNTVGVTLIRTNSNLGIIVHALQVVIMDVTFST